MLWLMPPKIPLFDNNRQILENVARKYKTPKQIALRAQIAWTGTSLCHP